MADCGFREFSVSPQKEIYFQINSTSKTELEAKEPECPSLTELELANMCLL